MRKQPARFVVWNVVCTDLIELLGLIVDIDAERGDQFADRAAAGARYLAMFHPKEGTTETGQKYRTQAAAVLMRNLAQKTLNSDARTAASLIKPIGPVS
jgi:hypothetical protein